MSSEKVQLKKPEILSPAGSIESVRAAVNAGCDAIYIGGSRFGARAYADNPQGDQMAEVIRYCHRYGVKVYMTVNTLLKEHELQQDLYDYIRPYYLEGLDAVIVQDVGVMNYLHRYFPDLEIHASTQMTLTMGESTELLEPYGVTRIVPARELTLQELVQMRQSTGLEIEVFVHGALCYCYSGQCLFSSMLGGRSGNRGRCAQPCRQRYYLEGEKTAGYYLSPREHCSLEHIGELMSIGVDSLKLEGRMKRPEYVALTTEVYRKYVDLCASLGTGEFSEYLKAHQDMWQEDMRRLAELYNRQGFTSGYMEGKSGVPYENKQGKGDMIAQKRPNHGGVLVGKVTAVDKHMVTYRLERELHAQDVVEFRDAGLCPSYEYTLGEAKRAGELVKARYLKGSRIRTGDLVYRTKDAMLLEELRNKYLQEDPKLSVKMYFTAQMDQPMELQVTVMQNGEKISGRVQGILCQKAEKNPAGPDDVKRVLCQTGGTVFECRSCEVNLQGELFLPVGALKKLRREALEKLQQKLDQRGGREILPECYLSDKPDGAPEKEAVHKSREEKKIVSVLYEWQAAMALEAQDISTIYLRMEQMSDQVLRELIRRGAEKGVEMYLMMPLIFRSAVYEAEKKKLEGGKSLYEMTELTGFVVRNMESFVFLTREAGIQPDRIITDANLYTANREAVRWWKEQGVAGSTLPLELTGKECGELTGQDRLEAVIYSYIPLMVSAQCIHRLTRGCAMESGDRDQLLRITDEKKRGFVVFNGCKYCYNIIYHEAQLSLGEEKMELWKQGIRRFRYDFTIEEPAQMREILRGRLPKGQKGHYYLPVE